MLFTNEVTRSFESMPFAKQCRLRWSVQGTQRFCRSKMEPNEDIEFRVIITANLIAKYGVEVLSLEENMQPNTKKTEPTKKTNATLLLTP